MDGILKQNRAEDRCKSLGGCTVWLNSGVIVFPSWKAGALQAPAAPLATKQTHSGSSLVLCNNMKVADLSRGSLSPTPFYVASTQPFPPIQSIVHAKSDAVATGSKHLRHHCRRCLFLGLQLSRPLARGLCGVNGWRHSFLTDSLQFVTRSHPHQIAVAPICPSTILPKSQPLCPFLLTMPRQYVFLGRPLPRFTSRRLTLVLIFLSIVAITLISTLTSGVPSSPTLSAADSKIKIPHVPHVPHVPHIPHIPHLPHIGDSFSNSFLNPFRQNSHPPPRSAKDEYAGSSWLADWTWLKVPFSRSITVDDDRALLPPLKPRQPIYCYYDVTTKKTSEEKDAESELLLTWRRAWWAQGFRPIILSASEAMGNPSYDVLQKLNVNAAFKEDLMRWLAWETMGGGILAHYTLLPIVPKEDSLLIYLRRGEYPHLTRWKELDDALFTGHKDDIKRALQTVTNGDPVKLEDAKDLISSLPPTVFKVEKASMPLAAYTSTIISEKYTQIADIIMKSRAEGLHSLNSLITAHLHVAWQNRFSGGIEVLKPANEHMGTLVSNGLQIARQLASCPLSPMPSTCPPNLPHCTPCTAKSPMTVSTPERLDNTSTIFSIGTVPHPWTFALLRDMRQSFNVSWIVQESPRDPWITAVTQTLLGASVSTTARLMRLKEAVAGDFATAHSLWVAAEKDLPTDMSWYFGFVIPTKVSGDSDGQLPESAGRLSEKQSGGAHAEDELVISLEKQTSEQPLIEKAKSVIALTKPTDDKRLRASLEAWNMADTEIWKFVRAFQSRRHQERAEWEKQEAKYSSGSGTEKGGSTWNRWQDRKSSDSPTNDEASKKNSTG